MVIYIFSPPLVGCNLRLLTLYATTCHPVGFLSHLRCVFMSCLGNMGAVKSLTWCCQPRRLTPSLLTKHLTFRCSEMSSDLIRPVWIATTHFVTRALHFGVDVSERNALRWGWGGVGGESHTSGSLLRSQCSVFIDYPFLLVRSNVITQESVDMKSDAFPTYGPPELWSFARRTNVSHVGLFCPAWQSY